MKLYDYVTLTYVHFLLFPTAIWAAIKECFPAAQIYGCGFHWVQCVRKKWSKLGLFSSQYKDHLIYLHRIWALRFAPNERIHTTFKKLKDHAMKNNAITHPIHQFFTYIETQWIDSASHPPSSWCQHGLQVRTNNSLESWHRSFNKRMGARPALYTFISKLAFDAEAIGDIIVKGDFVVRENKEKTALEEKITNATERFKSGLLKMSQLLDEICEIFKYGHTKTKKNPN